MGEISNLIMLVIVAAVAAIGVVIGLKIANKAVTI